MSLSSLRFDKSISYLLSIEYLYISVSIDFKLTERSEVSLREALASSY
jgi:hypothetical protein